MPPPRGYLPPCSPMLPHAPPCSPMLPHAPPCSPNPGAPPPMLPQPGGTSPHAPPTRGHLPPCSRAISITPSYIRRVPVNWSISQVHQITRRYLPRACMYSPSITPEHPNPHCQLVSKSCLSNQIARGTSPGHTCTPLSPQTDLPRTIVAGHQQGQLVNPSSIPCGLGCPGLS
jgi:hypothetical protein